MLRRFRHLLILPGLAALPAIAAPSLIGIHGGWGAFREGNQCHAVARAEPSDKDREVDPYASIIVVEGSAPIVHLRLSRAVPAGASVTLDVGKRRFRLDGNEYAARGRNIAAGGNAAIIAAMRQSDTMTMGASDWKGRRFRDAYRLTGAPTAIDAALFACAGAGHALP